MRTKISLLLGVAAFCVAGSPVFAQAPALTGTVSSAKEGVMEGVLVTAKKQGSNDVDHRGERRARPLSPSRRDVSSPATTISESAPSVTSSTDRAPST